MTGHKPARQVKRIPVERKKNKMNILRVLSGVGLAFLGLIIIKYGDKDVTKGSNEGGVITRVFSPTYLNPKLQKLQKSAIKWVSGLVAIWFGLWLIFDL